MLKKSEYLYEETVKALEALRKKRPLVECLTNRVTINDCANIILAIGASPIMAEDIREVEEVVAFSDAVVLNIGTLSEIQVKTMLKAGKKANELGIPVVFDPVGVGATTLRNDAAQEILNNVKVSVIRGNMSEIKALVGLTSAIKGVDASEDDAVKKDNIEEGIRTAKTLAQKYNCVVAATGEIDIIATSDKAYIIENESKMLACVTGTGCMVSCLVGAFCGATKDYAVAAVAGILTMCIAGEKANEKIDNDEGSGTFHTLLFDYTYNFSEYDIMTRGKINEFQS